MKPVRVLMIAAVCATLGVLTSVLVAWGCAAWGKSGAATATFNGSVTMRGNAFVGAAYTEASAEASGAGWDARWSDRLRSGGGPQEFESSYEFRAGWPLRCLASRIDTVDPTPAVVRVPGSEAAASWRGGLGVPGAAAGGVPIGRRLPLMPLWPGLMVNSAAYAAVLTAATALLWGVPAWRRARRRRRGLCVACGYPAGVGAVCSECGRAPEGRRTRPEGAAA